MKSGMVNSGSYTRNYVFFLFVGVHFVDLRRLLRGAICETGAQGSLFVVVHRGSRVTAGFAVMVAAHIAPAIPP